MPPAVAILAAWLKAGERLGNHTYDHESLNRTPLDAYIASTEHNDAVLRPILARRRQRPVWFRHPYLETGATLEVKLGFEAWLRGHRYRIAPVTLENSDWMFALPYDEAVLKGDRAEARRIRRAYIDYTAPLRALVPRGGQAVAWPAAGSGVPAARDPAQRRQHRRPRRPSCAATT
ncbi:MAG: polysaccharide deacetylase family protein [Caulobacteraceae bacterium]